MLDPSPLERGDEKCQRAKEHSIIYIGRAQDFAFSFFCRQHFHAYVARVFAVVGGNLRRGSSSGTCTTAIASWWWDSMMGGTKMSSYFYRTESV